MIKEGSDNSEMVPVQTAYDQWADEYDDADPTTALDEPFIMSMLEPFDGCRILDLGCGTGRYVRQIAGPNIELIGVDLSRAMLARAGGPCPPCHPLPSSRHRSDNCPLRLVRSTAWSQD